MNNNIHIQNDLFGEFVGIPNDPPPVIPIQTITMTELNQSINNLLIDNNMLYTKIMELEKEIKHLKDLISTIKYPQHQEQMPQFV